MALTQNFALSASQTSLLQARGLFTLQNYLSNVPEGSLLDCNNIVIDRDGIIGQRRGLNFYGTPFGFGSTIAKQLMTYKGIILRHWLTTVDYDSDGLGDFIALNNPITNPILSPAPGLRIRYAESNGNLYFTSQNGIQKIASTGTIGLTNPILSLAGGIAGLDGYGVLNPTPGWFLQDSQVAYRVVFGITDANGNVILGAPSNRIVVTNPASSLTVASFNALLTSLQQVAAADLTQPFHNTGFAGLVLPANATSTEIYDSLLVLANGTGNLLDAALTQTQTGNITAGSASVTGLTNTSYLDLGMVVTDATPPVTVTGNITTGSPTITNIVTTGITAGETITDGSLTQTLIGGIVAGSTQITGLSSVAGLVVGMPITDSTVGSNIPASTFISAINTSTLVVTMTNAAAATATADSILFTSNIPPGTTVLSTTINTVTMSNNATTTITADTFTFTANIPAGTTIIAINSSSSITLSNNATSTVTGDTLTFNSVAFTNITPPTAPLNPGTSQDYVNLQTYYNNLINELNLTNGISTAGKAAIAGAFLSANTTATVDLYFTTPPGLTTSYFYQIYRSDMATSTGPSLVTDVTADDEMRLIFEASVTAPEIAAGFIHFYDNIPESFRVNGTNLYTNAVSGEGILQANTAPPFATDLALYAGSMFYADTQTLQQVNLSLLGVTGLAGTTLEVLSNGVLTTYTFVTPVSQVVTFDTIAGSLFTSTGTADYFDIPNTNDILTYRVWFKVGTAVAPSTPSGQILVECAITNTDTPTQVATKLAIALNGLANTFTAVSPSTYSLLVPSVEVTQQTPGVAPTPTLHVANAGFTVTVNVAGNGESAALKQITASTASTPAQEITETATSIVRVINEQPGATVIASYLSGPTDVPGLMSFQVNNYTSPSFSIGLSNGTLGNLLFTNSLPQINIGTVTLGSNIISALPTNATDTIAIGSLITAPYVPTGTTVVSITDGQDLVMSSTATFTATEAITFGTPLNSLNQVNINRLYYSKTQEPEAVPLLNYIDIGSRDKRIVRIIALRTSLFVLKEDGVFQVSGTSPTNFQVNLFDDTAKIIGADTAVTLNNQIFMFSNQGVSSVSDTGISVVSRPIENLLLPLTNNPNFISASFGVSYESDRAYLLWVTTNVNDTTATQCFRWNTFTNTWTRWKIGKTCGVVVPETLRLYVGANDVNYIEQERKNFDRTDYADRSYLLSISGNQVLNNGATFSFGSLQGAVVGDAFVQTQYLTIPQFNRLLVKLDGDPGITTKNYFSTLQAIPGLNLRDQLTSLAAKLDAEPGLSGGYSAAISGFGIQFVDMQNAFNTIIGLLNIDPGIVYKNFITSVGTENLETTVTAVGLVDLLITLNYAQPWIQGNITLYSSITTNVIWNPVSFGDPGLLKRVREGTFIYANKAFSGATVAYASDLQTGYVSIPFVAESSGTWGNFIWGKQCIWGGAGSQIPLRTLIPPFQQRCRYISSQHTHMVAREEYMLYGLSYAYEMISTRGYR
jgi:hypothetical protein